MAAEILCLIVVYFCCFRRPLLCIKFHPMARLHGGSTQIGIFGWSHFPPQNSKSIRWISWIQSHTVRRLRIRKLEYTLSKFIMYMDPTSKNSILIKFAEDDHQLVGEAVLMAIRQHGASVTQPAGCSLWQNGGKKQRQCPVARTNTNIKLCTWRTWTVYDFIACFDIATLHHISAAGKVEVIIKHLQRVLDKKNILASLPSQQNIKCKFFGLWGFYLWRYDEHHRQSPRSCQLCTGMTHAWHQGSRIRKSTDFLESCSLSRTPAELKPETEKHNTADAGADKRMFIRQLEI